MLGVSVAGSCGDMLSVALKERLSKRFKKPKVMIVGKGALNISLEGWDQERLLEPMKLKAESEYDIIICVQCLESLRSLDVVNQGGKLFVVKGDQLVLLSGKQQELAENYMKIAGVKLKKGSRAEVPVEIEDFLRKAKASLKPDCTVLLIDFLSPHLIQHISASLGFNYYDEPFSHFLSRAPIGRMRVLNNHRSLAFYPHPMKDSGVNEILSRIMPQGAILPFIELEKKLSTGDKAVVEPFITSLYSVFAEWSSLVKQRFNTAKKIDKVLSHREELSELYSTVDLLGYDVSAGFFENAWFRTKQMLDTPQKIPLFAVALSLGRKGL